jgi:hypothetical protein
VCFFTEVTPDEERFFQFRKITFGGCRNGVNLTFGYIHSGGTDLLQYKIAGDQISY